MAKTKDKKEAIENVYLDAVMGNILDHYENTSYNLKLYMIGEEEWLRGQYAAEPGRTVVIAQTGVTGVQIDNLILKLLDRLKQVMQWQLRLRSNCSSQVPQIY